MRRKSIKNGEQRRLGSNLREKKRINDKERFGGNLMKLMVRIKALRYRNISTTSKGFS